MTRLQQHRTYTQNLLMFVPTPNKMYYCVLTNVLLVHITIIWPMPTPEHITKLRLEIAGQKFSPTKNSLQNLTYFRNVISNPAGKCYKKFPNDFIWWESDICFNFENAIFIEGNCF